MFRKEKKDKFVTNLFFLGGEWEVIGCFKDSTDRAMSVPWTSSSMTHEMCLDDCVAKVSYSQIDIHLKLKPFYLGLLLTANSFHFFCFLKFYFIIHYSFKFFIVICFYISF